MSAHSSTSYKGTQYDFSDIRKHGAGIWFGYHAITSGETTLEERKVICKRIRRTAEIFKCAECRGHFQEYIKDNPPEDTIGTPGGLFYWTVEFRNAVQRRVMREKNIQLPIYDPEIMYEIFHDMEAGTCDDDCGGEKSTTTNASNAHASNTNVGSVHASNAHASSVRREQNRPPEMKFNSENYIQIISRNGTIQWMPRPNSNASRVEGFYMYGR